MLIKSFDGNTFGSDYAEAIQEGEGIALPDVAAQMARRVRAHPILAGIDRMGRSFPLGLAIEGSGLDALRLQLFQWFDPEDETAKQLVATDDDGSSNERYLECICESLRPRRGRGGILPGMYVAQLRVHDDVRWRAVTVTTESAWNITASGQTRVVNNQGEDEAYPVVTVEPTSSKATGFQFKNWCPIIWESTVGATTYPIMLDPPDLTGDAQADGDDVRVYVNGVERDRWLGGTLVSALKVWVSLDFSARIVAEVGVAIAGAGAITEIVSDLSIVDFPSTGILLIGTEAFVYTGKSNIDKTFTGVTRTAKGTSIAAHGVGTTIEWVQHDLWLFYGDSSLTAPTVDDTYKPVFDLDASTNTSWDYDPTQSNCDGFGWDAAGRPGAWTFMEVLIREGLPSNAYTANHNTNSDPWEEIGIEVEPGGHTSPPNSARWYLANVCQITNVNFQSGDYWLDNNASPRNGSWKVMSFQTTWVAEYTESISGLTDDSAWHDSTLSRNEALTAASTRVGMQVEYGAGFSEFFRVEFEDVVVTLDSTLTPDVSVNAQQSNYQLEATITIEETGDAITLSFGMEVNEELEVDSVAKTVTYLEDDSGQRQALATSGVRRHWLPLAEGNNTLRFDETGLVGVRVTVAYRRRYYL